MGRGVVDWASVLGLLCGGVGSLSNALMLYFAALRFWAHVCMMHVCVCKCVTHELLYCCWEAVQCIAAQRIVLHRRDCLHCVDLGWASID